MGKGRGGSEGREWVSVGEVMGLDWRRSQK